MRHPIVAETLSHTPRAIVVDAVRQLVRELRGRLESGETADVDVNDLASQVASLCSASMLPSLRPAINATGVILHTGLGRAVLSKRAIDAVISVATGHSTLEIEVESGRRGHRISHVEGIIRQLTSAESATVVNNNAAAVLLAINSIAAGGEVIISRGQLVEIGGQFRVPEIIKSAGCRLVEVGTTNRTRIEDYANAITEETGLILIVHPSNFRVVGFTEDTPLRELIQLGVKSHVPVMFDLGSGVMVESAIYGLQNEPTVQESIKSGCDLVAFSGDKLLGGPQAGVIAGRSDLIEQCAKNPLARALRPDKLTLAALEATLRIYLEPNEVIENIPALRYIHRPASEVLKMANLLASKLRTVLGDSFQVDDVSSVAQIGSGSLPGQKLESGAVRLKSSVYSAEYLGSGFRQFRTPIFGRIESDAFMLDLRTVEDEDIEMIIACAEVLAGSEGQQ